MGPKQMEMQEIESPQAVSGEVVLRVDAVGICGSELSGYLGHNSLRVPPLIMGHEFAGTVSAVGEGAGLRSGDRVVVNPLLSCGTCRLCELGLPNLCAQRSIIGIHRPGAFAEYVKVPVSACLPLPADLSASAGALAEPLACGVRATALGGVGPGVRTLVLGAGTIGLMCIAAVRKAGGDVTLVADVNAGRLKVAEEWGAHNACNPKEADVVQAAKSLSGGVGVDVAIDAVGSSATRRAALSAVRPGGIAVFVGLHEAESAIQANDLVRSEVRITGSFAYAPGDFAIALAMLAGGDVRTAPNWVEERGLEACARSFAQLIDAPPAAAKIMLKP